MVGGFVLKTEGTHLLTSLCEFREAFSSFMWCSYTFEMPTKQGSTCSEYLQDMTNISLDLFSRTKNAAKVM